MPEYHNLQAYARYDERTFRAGLSRYRGVLQAIGCYDQRVEDWLARIEWDVSDNGFVYTGSHDPWVEFESAGMLLKAGPHVIGFTPEVYAEADRAWVEYGLLFETEHLQYGSSFSAWEYKQGLDPAIWKLMQHFGCAFSELGVFFTDEAQDGEPFEGLVKGSDKRWQFDLAWVPVGNAALFTPVLKSFFHQEVDGALALAPKRAWKGPPWT